MDINIGERITYFRTAKGFSVNYLANQSGVSQSYLREIEMGHYSNPSVDILDALCHTLGISLSEFFDIHTDLQNTDDSLLHEISLLTPTQRDNLRILLNSIHSEPKPNHSETL